MNRKTDEGAARSSRSAEETVVEASSPSGPEHDDAIREARERREEALLAEGVLRQHGLLPDVDGQEGSEP